jgi:N-ethylmaleimide reductase
VPDLFTPYVLGALTLPNRVVMSPMTRARSADHVANDMTARYYGQRAEAGLIITEGTPVSPQAQGYAHVPGIWSGEQADGWRLTTDAVHANGGRIFAQLWHVGRISHHSMQPGGAAPVSSTAKAPGGDATTYGLTDDGSLVVVRTTPPRALTTDEVQRTAQDFGRAARNAEVAGFDGVEVHSANGYLFEQFLNPAINDRTDRYGGSVENRSRLLLETVDRVADALGPDRVGVRLSPYTRLFDSPPYDETRETYLHLAAELATRGVAYVHLNDPLLGGVRTLSDELLGELKATFGGTIVLAGAMTDTLAANFIDRGLIDLAAFGQAFIGNPDLVARIRHGWPLHVPDRATFYGGDDKGYTDYAPYLETGAAVSGGV